MSNNSEIYDGFLEWYISRVLLKERIVHSSLQEVEFQLQTDAPDSPVGLGQAVLG